MTCSNKPWAPGDEVDPGPLSVCCHPIRTGPNGLLSRARDSARMSQSVPYIWLDRLSRRHHLPPEWPVRLAWPRCRSGLAAADWPVRRDWRAASVAEELSPAADARGMVRMDGTIFHSDGGAAECSATDYGPCGASSRSPSWSGGPDYASTTPWSNSLSSRLSVELSIGRHSRPWAMPADDLPVDRRPYRPTLHSLLHYPTDRVDNRRRRVTVSCPEEVQRE